MRTITIFLWCVLFCILSFGGGFLLAQKKMSQTWISQSEEVVSENDIKPVLGAESGAQQTEPNATPLEHVRIPSFMLLGNVQSEQLAQQKTAAAIRAVCDKEQCLGGFMLGNVLTPTGVVTMSDPIFSSGFEELFQQTRMPYWIAYGADESKGCRQCYLHYALKSDNWKMPSPYYKVPFPEQNIAFFVIDTENFDEKQRTWLEKELAISPMQWNLVVGFASLQTDSSSLVTSVKGDAVGLRDVVCRLADVYVSGEQPWLGYESSIDSSNPNCRASWVNSGTAGSVGQVPTTTLGFTSAEQGYTAIQIPYQGKPNLQFFSADGKELRTVVLQKR